MITDLSTKVQKAIIDASTSYYADKKSVYEKALKIEEKYGNTNAVWALEQIITNFKVANESKLPLCDDTGIPHVILEIGEEREVPSKFFKEIKLGISDGLNKLPARPMAVKGNDIERIEQSCGLYDEPGMMKPVSFLIEEKDGSTYSNCLSESNDKIKIHLLLEGGGPEIRAKTYRIYHERSLNVILGETINWLKESLAKLGCTPSIPVIGIGRTHFEANSLMLRAMVHGKLDVQSNIENFLCSKLNKTNIGPLGLGGKTTVLGSFINIGYQRASGVRIVATRPACFVEPRIATVEF